MAEGEANKISELDFVVRAIKRLRKPPFKGIHSVYSGFNRAYKDYFSKDPVEATTRMAQEGKIATRPVKGGVMLYLPEEAPPPRGSQDVLEKILAENDTPSGQT
jgi:hypothetical protein